MVFRTETIKVKTSSTPKDFTSPTVHFKKALLFSLQGDLVDLPFWAPGPLAPDWKGIVYRLYTPFCNECLYTFYVCFLDSHGYEEHVWNWAVKTRFNLFLWPRLGTPASALPAWNKICDAAPKKYRQQMYGFIAIFGQSKSTKKLGDIQIFSFCPPWPRCPHVFPWEQFLCNLELNFAVPRPNWLLCGDCLGLNSGSRWSDVLPQEKRETWGKNKPISYRIVILLKLQDKSYQFLNSGPVCLKLLQTKW